MSFVEVRNVWWVAAAGLVGFAGNELVAVYRIRVGRRIGSAALVADGLHHPQEFAAAIAHLQTIRKQLSGSNYD
mgnify:CR=1 FL=1